MYKIARHFFLSLSLSLSKKDAEKEEQPGLLQVSIAEILEAQREELELKEQQEQLKQKVLSERGFDLTEPDW
jgi:hypothetical protein